MQTTDSYRWRNKILTGVWVRWKLDLQELSQTLPDISVHVIKTCLFPHSIYIALNAHGGFAAVKPGHSHASREEERVR